MAFGPDIIYIEDNVYCLKEEPDMPDNSGKRVINIIFRIIIAGVFYTGIKAVYNFYMLMTHYQLLQGEELFNRVALLTDDYMFMMLSMIAAIIFNVLTRKQISSKAFTVRTISIVTAFITGCMSFPAIGMLAYIAIAKYPQLLKLTALPEGMFTLSEVYASPMTDWLIARPYLFYMYFISCAIFAVLCATSIYTYVKGSTKKNKEM